MNRLEPELEQAVEAICALGCTVVRDCIRALQQAQSRPEYQSLEPQQLPSLLYELQAIMAVYDGS
jgi:hypothetical protein